MTAEAVPSGGSDRSVVARLLAEMAYDVFDRPAVVSTSPIRLRYKIEVVGAGKLTDEQVEFVRARMRPCPPELVASATHRVTWTDSEEIPNVAYCGPLGPVVPIVARESTLALWRMLRADQGLTTRVLAADDQVLLASVTTDQTPLEILRTGVDAAARVLVQHALLAAQTPYDEPAGFAEVLRDSGIFTTVAGTWHWGLQASTYRRGLIPVRLIAFGGRVTYSADTVAALRAMKEARMALAHTVDHDEAADPSALQYGALDPGEQPRCLAHGPQTVGGRRVTLVKQVADSFVDTFIRLLDVVHLVADSSGESADISGSETTFEVPDMTCQHCIRTITKTVAEFGVDPPQFDLETKRVVATFPSTEIRDQSLAAVRARGYTVVLSAVAER